MIKVLINGACGRMGCEVEKLVDSAEDMKVAAKVDKMADKSGCYSDINDYNGEADVIIDFSNHLGTAELLDYAVKKNIPIVIATTGHTDEELEIINEASKKIPVFHSANMSLGVALLVDAPSGTALMIAKELKKVRQKAKFVLGRSGNGKREPDEIGISAVRRGNIVGIHEVYVSTDSQTITLKHEAHSRALFAEGGISAARFILGKPAGLYDMNSIVTE